MEPNLAGRLEDVGIYGNIEVSNELYGHGDGRMSPIIVFC